MVYKFPWKCREPRRLVREPVVVEERSVSRISSKRWHKRLIDIEVGEVTNFNALQSDNSIKIWLYHIGQVYKFGKLYHVLSLCLIMKKWPTFM